MVPIRTRDHLARPWVHERLHFATVEIDVFGHLMRRLCLCSVPCPVRFGRDRAGLGLGASVALVAFQYSCRFPFVPSSWASDEPCHVWSSQSTVNVIRGKFDEALYPGVVTIDLHLG